KDWGLKRYSVESEEREPPHGHYNKGLQKVQDHSHVAEQEVDLALETKLAAEEQEETLNPLSL
ncbi:hypothetical protein HAX54_044817, partial [Datura stramonium]|nr:hypothetical protein [Datura stramonium]